MMSCCKLSACWFLSCSYILATLANHSVLPDCSRHDDSVVLYDHSSDQLVHVLDGARNIDRQHQKCPYCHQTMRSSPLGGGDRNGRRPGPRTQQRFVNPNYFRMLNANPPTPFRRPIPSSPRPRLAQLAPREDAPETESNRRSPAASTPGISSSAFSPNYFEQFFVEERELGRGGKGVVLLVKHVLDGVSLGQYACKRVPVGDDHEWLKKVLIEVQLLQHLSHQNLVSYRHVWLESVKISSFGPSVPCAFILQQYCNAGDLHQYVYGSVQTTTTTPQELKERIRRRSKGQPEHPTSLNRPRELQFEQIYSFFKDITSGLTFLHMNGYIHRDLKPSNCLLHETGRELRVLVSDFGEVQSENTVRTSTGSTGTVSYCAPEVLRRHSPDGPFGNFTFKSDVFSLGMILYFLCFAQLPYRHADIVDEAREDLDQLRAEISQWGGFDNARRIRPDLPDKLYSFLTRLLSLEPDNRPTAEDVLNGIRSGTDDERRFYKQGTSSSGISTSSRVLPVDSPAPERSPSRDNGELSPLGQPLSSTSSLIAHSHTFQPQGYGSTPGISSPSSDTESEPPPSRSGSASNNVDQGIVIRHTPPSPRVVNHHPVNMRPQQLYSPRHLLLPPPNRLSLIPYLRAYRATIKVIALSALLILKVSSLTQPCSPLTVRPWVFYPLLALATLVSSVTSIWIQSGALAFHVLVIAVTIRTGTLCVSDAHVYENLF